MLRLLVATATATPAANGQVCPDNLFQFVCSAIQDRVGDQSSIGPVAQGVLEGIVLFAVIVICGRLLRHVVMGHLDRGGHDPQVRTLARNGLTVLTWLLAIVGGLVGGGLPATYVLTFGGVFSLAIGLAFQDVFRNVLAGIFILVEKPFRIGDQVSVGDQTGVVRTINLRTTELRTDDGRLAVLPNLSAFNGVILNSTAFDRRRYSLTLLVAPRTDLPRLIGAVRDELAATAAIAVEPAPAVRPDTDAEGRHTVVVSYWLEYRTHDPEAVRSDLLPRLWRAAGKTGPSEGGAAAGRSTG
jgi:small-conductance mechanosensitive channel